MFTFFTQCLQLQLIIYEDYNNNNNNKDKYYNM